MSTASDPIASDLTNRQRYVLVRLDELDRLKLALMRARDYHPVNRQLWIQFAGLVQRVEKQPVAAEQKK